MKSGPLYEELIRKLNALARAVTNGNYDNSEVDDLFKLTQKGRYPSIFTELAESFGLMLVKLEVKEFSLEQISFELNRAKGSLAEHLALMEKRVIEQISEFSSKSMWLEQDIRKRWKLEKGLQEANQKLMDLVNLDELTKLSNRRCFNAHIKESFKLMERTRAPLSLIMCDVDFFKLYNDTYGHLKGDECLQAVAQAIKRRVNRVSDLTARYGGEEFAVILPHTEPENAFKVAENIRKEVESLKILHEVSPVSPYVTISLGIGSATPMQQMTIETLMKNADMALYDAKRRGSRNCSVLWQKVRHMHGKPESIPANLRPEENTRIE